jgi:hypothetical protein
MARIDSVIAKYREEIAAHRQVADRLQRDLTERERYITVLEARIAGMEEARDLVEPRTRVRLVSNGTRKARQVSGHWKEIMEDIGRKCPFQFGYEELENAARRHGLEVRNRDNLRSQMSLYKDRGIVEAVGSGTFRICPEAAAAVGINVTNVEALDAKTPRASNGSGLVDGSQGRGSHHDPEGSIPSSSTFTQPAYDADLDDDVPF